MVLGRCFCLCGTAAAHAGRRTRPRAALQWAACSPPQIPRPALRRASFPHARAGPEGIAARRKRRAGGGRLGAEDAGALYAAFSGAAEAFVRGVCAPLAYARALPAYRGGAAAGPSANAERASTATASGVLPARFTDPAKGSAASRLDSFVEAPRHIAGRVSAYGTRTATSRRPCARGASRRSSIRGPSGAPPCPTVSRAGRQGGTSPATRETGLEAFPALPCSGPPRRRIRPRPRLSRRRLPLWGKWCAKRRPRGPASRTPAPPRRHPPNLNDY